MTAETTTDRHHHTTPAAAYLLTQWGAVAAPRWWPAPAKPGIISRGFERAKICGVGQE